MLLKRYCSYDQENKTTKYPKMIIDTIKIMLTISVFVFLSSNKKFDNITLTYYRIKRNYKHDERQTYLIK